MARQSLLTPGVIIVAAAWLGGNPHLVTAAASPACADDRYEPIPGGWQIHLHNDDFYKDIARKNQTVRMDGRDVPGVEPATGRLGPDGRRSACSWTILVCIGGLCTRRARNHCSGRRPNWIGPNG